jgi:hypothetical protein
MGFADSVRKEKNKSAASAVPGTLSVEDDLATAIITATENEYLDGTNKHRAEGWHPSQLSKMCPRLEVLRQLMPKAIDKSKLIPDLRTQVIFDVGHALHRWFQEQYFGPMERLKGTWVCRLCGAVTDDVVMPARPHPCRSGSCLIEIGKNRFWSFREPALENKEWGIIGHCDGIYVPFNTDIDEAVLEIKTAGPAFWQNPKAPLRPNVFQINIYMWLLGLTRGVLLYVDKAGVNKKGRPFKEFIIDYNDAPRKEACEKIDEYRRNVEAQTMPRQLTFCEVHPTGARARQCPLRAICMDQALVTKLGNEWGEVRYF